MSYDEYFSDSDKPYCENLNDALLLLDAFNVNVPVKMPDMFSNGEFNSTLNVNRKCGVSIITLKSVDNGVTVGTNTITGTGEIVFRIYPNFNGFYKWNKINLDKTGTVEIGFKKTDGTVISATVASDGTISENVALKTLQEVDLVLTLSSATISGVNIEFVNNHNNITRVGALLEAGQLTGVHSTILEDDNIVVTGGAVFNAIQTATQGKEEASNKVDSLDNSEYHYPSCKAVKTVTDTKENASNKVTVLNNSTSNYPSCSAVKTVTDAKEDSSNKVTSLNNSTSNYPSCSAVKSVTDAKEDASNKVTSLDNSDSHYPSSKAVKTVTDAKLDTSERVNSLNTSSTNIPSCYALSPILEMISKLVTVSCRKTGNNIIITSNVPNLLFSIKYSGQTANGVTESLEETVELPSASSYEVIIKFPAILTELYHQTL